MTACISDSLCKVQGKQCDGQCVIGLGHQVEDVSSVSLEGDIGQRSLKLLPVISYLENISDFCCRTTVSI